MQYDISSGDFTIASMSRSTTIVKSFARATIPAMAAQNGNSSAPATPAVNGMSISVRPAPFRYRCGAHCLRGLQPCSPST